MVTPDLLTEPEAIARSTEVQLRALRAAAYGLTDEQDRLTPCRGSLSVAGLLKHVTYGLDGYVRRLQAPEAVAREGFPPERFAEYFGSFAVTEQETLEEALAAFDAAAARYLDAVRAADPARQVLQPPAPWEGRDEPSETVQRVHLLHGIEEIARHAGHADLLREQIDAATAGELQAAVEGRPANAFVTPWRPPEQPGSPPSS